MTTAMLTEWILGLAVVFAGAIVCALPEFIAPIERQTWESRVRACLFWSLFLAAAVIVVIPVQAIIQQFGLRPLISIDLRAAFEAQNPILLVASYLLLPLLPSLLFDCLYYWFHRLQHAVPLLWRFHSVHHAIEELNAANCYHHVSEAVFRLPFILLPLMLIIELRVPDVFLVSAGVAAWGQFVHANTRISFGPLDYVFAGPRFHRVHHSLAEEHHDRNFASFFPFLDLMFGTAYFPRADEVVRTGLTDKREALTIGEYVFSLAPRDAAANPAERTATRAPEAKPELEGR